jgi:hypothetical protein
VSRNRQQGSGGHRSHGERHAPPPAVHLPPSEVAAIGALAAVAAAARGERVPTEYESDERGRQEIDGMNDVWAGRAARAVAEGRRPQNDPAVIEPLLEQSGGAV